MSQIRFEQVCKQFTSTDEPVQRGAERPRPAVDGVSLTVDDGSLVILLGPSGCGKTTLLKMVNRLYEPTSGTILIDGSDIRQMPVTELRRQIGYVIQETGLFPHMTVAENVAVVPQLLEWSKERIQQRVDELLDLVQLPARQYRERYPAQLSGGQQQRVGVARGLAGDPKVLLMDEPFGAIDAITRAGLQNELLRLQRKLQKTILFVTHDVEEALYLADKIAVMRAGKVVQYDTPFNILTNPADEFVAELVGAEDIIRQLSQVRVESEMEPLPPSFQPQGRPRIDCDDNLRHALAQLLKSGSEELLVMDGDAPVGLLSLARIRTSAGERAVT